MKISYAKVATTRHEVDVPDEYAHDDSIRGKVVDALLADFVHRGLTTRDRLHNGDADIVEHAISRLRESYAMADRVLAAIKDYVTI